MAALRLCIVLASFGVALHVAADESTGWRALYREGSRQYDLGDFRAALDSFKRAYLAHEEAGILFDIAECHRQLGEDAEAVHAYQSYLRRKPDAANRGDVEALIAKLQGTPAAKPATPAPSPATPKPSTPPRVAATPVATAPPPAAAAPVATAPSVSTPVPAPSAPVAAHGSVYNPWGTTASAAPPPPGAPAPAAEPATTATVSAAPSPAGSPAPAATPATAATPAPAATSSTAPPAWAPTAVETAPPRKKSRAWIAAIVVPAVAVLAVSIGVTAWYFSPAPTYTKVGPAQ